MGDGGWGGGGRGWERRCGFLTNATTQRLETSNHPLGHPELSFFQQHFPSKEILFFQNLPARKNWPEEQIF